ncbi:MAG: hypothetical protein LBF15_03635 [Candidatus Peribacteria bacterium]|jgi:histone acetyltransferase (RNA polymerase elongator complex component)|nr:hypothetical protein [Candidatus Peribacteria bacterium]
MKEFIEETEFTSENFATFKIKETYKPNLAKDLEEAKKINETAPLRVIGIAIETRPDWVNPDEILRLR